MLKFKRMLSHYLKYMMPSMPSVGASTIPPWTLCQGFCKPPWRNRWNNILLSLYEHWDFSQCEHMLFWLCNAPATFQWLMTNCSGELNYLPVWSIWIMSLFIQVHKKNTLNAYKQCWSAFDSMDWSLKPSKWSTWGIVSPQKGYGQTGITWRPSSNTQNPPCTLPLKVLSDSVHTTSALLRTLPG